MTIFSHLIIIFSAIIFEISQTIQFEIKENQRPDLILRNGDAQSVILDCSYELNDTLTDDLDGFTVKWFYESDLEPIYQWIPDLKSTSVRGFLEEYIDTNFSISENPYCTHRALHLKNIETNLTGLYKCVVSTFSKEEYQEQKLVIYEPEKHFDIMKINEGPNITIICSASDLFPEPKITIAMQKDLKEEIFDNIENAISRGDNGFYNITAIAIFQEEIDQPVDFKCKLEIDDANYQVIRDLHYYPDTALPNGSLEPILMGLVLILIWYNH